MAEQSVDELQKQLTEYREQLEIVDAALKENPDNSEFLEVKSNLLDVLEVTEDLLKLKKETSEVDANYQEQFRENQKIAQRRGLFVGKEMQARYSADGKFYKAKSTFLSSRLLIHSQSLLSQKKGSVSRFSSMALRILSVPIIFRYIDSIWCTLMCLI